MAEKLGLLDQFLFGNWAERSAINRNAEDLANVETNLAALRTTVQQQAQALMRLRAMFMGLVEVINEKTPIDEAELGRAIEAAWNQMTAPPPQPAPATDPYRNTPSEPSADQIEAAKTLLAAAQKHHFGKRFQDARTIYQQIVDEYGDTKQAVIARQQLDNLRNA